MALNLRRFFSGIRIMPKTTSTVDSSGELDVTSATGKLNYHNGTTSSPLVSESHSATLTNKTIDADLNALSNIDNADIKAGAAIDRTKLAAGTADRVLINDGSGVLTESTVTTTELNQLSGITGGVITTTSTDTLTNKSLVDASTFIIDDLDNTKKVQFQAATLTTGTTRTLSVPDADTTIVGTDVAQTLTNKTISGATNTISNVSLTASVTGVLPIANGGTNSSSALSNNRVIQSSSGAIIEAAAITANRALISDANGIPTHSVVTDTELASLSGVTGTLVSASATQTLTNKSLEDSTTFIIDNLDNTKKMQFQASSISTGTTRTLTIPDANTTIVGTDVAQILTNKDFDGGTASNTSRITVPQDTKTNLDALTRKEGTIVYANDLDTLYIDDGTILKSIGSGSGGINYIENPDAESSTTGWNTTTNNELVTITIATPAVITISTPPLANPYHVGQAVTFSTTGALPTGITAGTTYYVTTIVDTSSFRISATQGGADVNTSGTQSGVHTVRAQTPNNTIGSTTLSPNITLTRTTSSPLRGDASFLITKDAANRQGEEVYYDFTIDSADTTKVLQVSFDYNIASGTYSGGTSTTDSDIVMYIEDVTNESLIQLAPYKLDGAVVGQQYIYRATFQASTSTSYRLRFHIATTSTSAYTVKFDNVIVGPQLISYTANISDVIDAGQMLLGAVTTAPTKWTTRTDTVTYFREGKYAVINYTLATNTPTGGAGGSGDYLVGLPSGLSADTSITGTTTAAMSSALSARNILVQGVNHRSDSYVTPIYAAMYNSTQFRVNVSSGAFWGSGSNGLTNANSHNIQFTVLVPIAGWGSSLSVSDQSDGRVVAARISGDPASASSGNPIIFPTSAYDTHGAYNASTGQYTVPVSGYYNIHGFITSANATIGLSIYVDGSSVISVGQTDSNGECAYSGSVFVNSGQLIDLRPNGTLDASSGSTIHFERLSGNSVPFAQETVSARYYASATSISGTLATISWTTKDFDTHNQMSSGTYTVPVSGKYDVSSAILLSGTFALNDTTIMEIQKNGSVISRTTEYAGGAITQFKAMIKDTINCVSGDTIRIQVSSSGTTPAVVSSNFDNYVSISKIGN